MTTAKLMLCFVGLLCTFLGSFTLGRYPISVGTAMAVLAGRGSSGLPSRPQVLEAIIWNVRLPRILAAVLVGAALSVAGAAYQGMLRNPLVSPGILGASGGAGLGAAVAIVSGWTGLAVPLLAFVGGLVAVLSTWSLGAWMGRGRDPILIMVMAGIVVGSLCTAVLSIVKLVSDPANTLPAITFWLMGGLGQVALRDLGFAAPPIVAGILFLGAVAWQLDALSLGEDESRALGIATHRLRALVIVSATLITAAAVAISGIIALVGLIVPHLARLLLGPRHAILIPASAALGGTFLLCVDDLARACSGVDLPLGILTSLVGAPILALLLKRTGR